MHTVLKKPILFTFENLERMQDNKNQRKKLIKELDKKIGEIASKDPEIYKKIVFLTATYLFNSSIIANASTIDEAGAKLYGMVQSIGYWTILIMLCIDIMRNCRNGKDSVVSVIVRYLLLGAALFGGKWFLDIIRELF